MSGSSGKFGTTPAEWDDLYGKHGLAPGGRPNEVLVAEVEAMLPGRALETGCGTGDNAIWLADRGWSVTGVDVSSVALGRAQAAALQAGLEIDWVCGALEGVTLPPAGFDLVTAFYPALHRSESGEAQRALLAAVAPGGTLLVVHHADVDVERSKSFGFDPEHYVSHEDMAAVFDGNWEVSIQRGRHRRTDQQDLDPALLRDDVIRARRLT